MSSLRVKLAVALLFTALAGIMIIAVLVQQVTVSEFDTFIAQQAKAKFIADVTAYYEVVGSWDDIETTLRRFPPEPPPGGWPGNALSGSVNSDTGELVGNASPGFNPYSARLPDMSPLQYVLFDLDGTVLLSDWANRPDQEPPKLDKRKATPIKVDGDVVGYIMPVKDPFGRDQTEEDYLKRINQMLLAATIGAIVLALILSFTFARSLSKPLREITAAIRSVSQGDLSQKVPVRSKDEIGQVAVAFNQMSDDLARANQLRKQMTADIAHELRTPMSVINGYLASMSEGLLKPTPERFKIMNDESQHLQRLIEDLRTLSLADAGELPLNRRPVAASELIKLVGASFSHQAEQRAITLVERTDPDLRLLNADPDRIIQVLSNLVANALRHTPEQGTITLRSVVARDTVSLSVADTGPGIAPDHVPHIFERFYRADSSRHQTQNESGLGLAIAKSIVDAHGGTIAVESVVGSGTTFTITFPSPVEGTGGTGKC